MRSILVVAALVVGLMPERPAEACSLAGNDLHQRDPMHASDATPPAAPVIVDARVYRTEDDGDALGCSNIAGCGSYGVIMVDADTADDATPEEQIGYQVRLVSGTLPRGMELPSEAVTGWGELYFYFDHEAPGFEAEIELRAVDLNGNMGAPVTFVIGDAPRSEGCATSGAAGSWLVLGAALLVLVRRRNSRAIGC